MKPKYSALIWICLFVLIGGVRSQEGGIDGGSSKFNFSSFDKIEIFVLNNSTNQVELSHILLSKKENLDFVVQIYEEYHLIFRFNREINSQNKTFINITNISVTGEKEISKDLIIYIYYANDGATQQNITIRKNKVTFEPQKPLHAPTTITITTDNSFGNQTDSFKDPIIVGLIVFSSLLAFTISYYINSLYLKRKAGRKP